MAQLILLACTAFVIYLLRIEAQASRVNSLALWIPTTWLMIAASRPLPEWFINLNPGHAVIGNDSGSGVDELTFGVLAVAGIVTLILRRFNYRVCLRRNVWLIVLLGYILLSALWADISLICLRRGIRELIAPLMAMVVISEVKPAQALAGMLRRTAYVLLPYSIVLIKYYPSIGVQYGRWSGILMWCGVTAQKNELGRLCAISCLFLIFALYRYWKDRVRTPPIRAQATTDLLILILGMFLLIGSHSATSLVSFILGSAIFFSFVLFRRLVLALPRMLIFAGVLSLIAFGVATPFLGGSDVARFTSSLGRDSTLTGRTEVWASVLPERATRPLLGFGYGSFWTDARRQMFDIPTGHNGYLDVMLELGEVGLLLYMAWLFSITRQIHSALRRDFSWASLGIAYLLVGLLYNTTESSLNSLSEYMTAITLFVSFVVSPAVLPIKERVRSRSPKDTLGSPPKQHFRQESLIAPRNCGISSR